MIFQNNYNSKEIDSRREALCVWLSDNRVPYTVTSDHKIEVMFCFSYII